MLSLLLSTSLYAAPLTLPESLELVAHGNLEVQISKLESEKVRLSKFLAMSQLLPKVEAKASWLDYGESLEANMMGDSATDLDCSSLDALGFGDLCSSLSTPLLLREDKVFEGNIRILYPLTALYSIPYGYRAISLLTTASELEIEQTKKRIQLSVIEVYMEALHLQAVVAFAQESEGRLNQHRRNIEAFVDQGYVNAVELLRLDNAIFETQLGANEAQQGFELLCRQLKLLVGVAVEPVPLKSQLQISQNNSQSEALRIAQLEADAAMALTRASYGQLFPNVVLLASQSNSNGQGPLMPSVQNYLGLAVQGNFNWGERWIETNQRRRDTQMAKIAVDALQRSIPLQQQQAKQAWHQAEGRLLLALRQAKLTNELLRQANQTHQEQLSTTAQLLDAESDHLKATLNISAAKSTSVTAKARYEHSLNSVPFFFAPLD